MGQWGDQYEVLNVVSTTEVIIVAGESGRRPTLADTEALLTACGVPHNPDELYWILQDTIVPGGVGFADLVFSPTALRLANWPRINPVNGVRRRVLALGCDQSLH